MREKKGGSITDDIFSVISHTYTNHHPKKEKDNLGTDTKRLQHQHAGALNDTHREREREKESA